MFRPRQAPTSQDPEINALSCAGGGGYMLMLAKDADAAGRIRHTLQATPPNSHARFVDVSLSLTGLQITRS